MGPEEAPTVGRQLGLENDLNPAVAMPKDRGIKFLVSWPLLPAAPKPSARAVRRAKPQSPPRWETLCYEQQQRFVICLPRSAPSGVSLLRSCGHLTLLNMREQQG